MAYSDEWQEPNPPGPPQEVFYDGRDLYYTVERVFQEFAGFYALGLQSDVYGPALVIRGTELTSGADWWADVDPEGVGRKQFVANWPTVSNWLRGLSKTPDIIGYSLGGALAQWIAAAFTSGGRQIDQLVTFNATGISKPYADSFVPANATSVTHHIVNGDVVSMAGEAFVPGKVRMASFTDLNLLGKHLLPLLVPAVGDRYRPADVSWQDFDSVDALNDPSFSYTDRDYRLWLIGLQVALESLAVASPAIIPLVPVPAMLMHRGTTESGRQLIGRALREAEDLWEWTAQTGGRFVLTLKERAHDLYEATQISVEEGFSLEVDQGDPPMLQFQGGLSVDVGDNININLPSWLGGSFTAEHLMHLVEMDVNGVMDRHHLAVDSQLAVLGNLLTLNGSQELDWRRGEWAASGQIDVLDGFVTAASTIRVGAGLDLVTQGGAEVNIPEAVPWIGGTHIVGGAFMLKFVNDGNMANDFVAGWGSIGGLELGLRAYFDGRWDILGAREIDSLILPAPRLTASGDERARAAAGTLLAEATPYSESYSIAPGTNWGLFTAEWENPSLTAALTLQTPSGQVLTEADIEADPSMAMIPELSNDRRKVVRVDAPEAGTWVVTLTDTTGLGAVDIAAFVSDAPPTVNVVGLSGGVARRPVQVDLEAYDADSEARIGLFYDTDNQGFDGVMIADRLLESDGLTQYSWDTSGVAAGDYYVYAMILDGDNPPVFDYSDSPVKITDPATVEGRRLFYNNSKFDAHAGFLNGDPAANEFDDGAIDPAKEALLPGGGKAAFQNYTSFSRGLNGIMVDVAGLPAATLAAADFAFTYGNDDTPADWLVAADPTTIAVRAGAGFGGSDRVTLIWPDNAIPNGNWLRVAVNANTHTGLAADDVFYFGSAIGETGNSPGPTPPADAKVNSQDVTRIRNNYTGFGTAGIESVYDFNRDRKVNSQDVTICRNYYSGFTPLSLITPPAAAPLPVAATEARPDGRAPAQGGSSDALAVAGTSPELVGTLSPFSTIDVTFTKAIDPATFGTGDVGLLDLAGLDVSLLGSFGGPFNDSVTDGSLLYSATDAGLQIFDVSDPTQVTRVGTYAMQQDARAVQVVGNLAYVANSFTGLEILDVTNPAAVTRRGGYNTSGLSYGVQVVGHLAYVADYDAGLQILDVSNPAAVTRLGGYNTSGYAYSVHVVGTRAYVADDYAGLQILDVTNPAGVTLLGGYDTPGTTCSVQVVGSVAYLADSDLEILDVTNPASVTRLGGYNSWGFGRDVLVAGSLAYLANDQGGVYILNVSVPGAVSRLGGYDTPGYAMDVKLIGNLAYVADDFAGLQILDVSTPAAVTRLGGYASSANAWDVQVVGNLAYVADTDAGLQIVDISDPAGPTGLGGYNTTGEALGVKVVGTLAYVADGSRGLQILDVSNPGAIVRLGGYDTSGIALKVDVAGGFAYVADASAGLQVLDVSTPTSVTLRDTYNTPGSAESVQVVGNLAYVADNSSGLQILNVSNPDDVTLAGAYDTPGRAYDVQVLGSRAYVADGDGGLHVLNVSIPAAVTRLGGYGASTAAQDVQVVGSLAYLINYAADLEVLDVSNPAAVTRLDWHETSGRGHRVQVMGNLAYVADGSGGVEIVQLGDPVASISHVAGNTYRVDLGRRLPNGGEFALQLGPEILDTDGAAMDQDQDGTPREASEDVYFARFRTDLAPRKISLRPFDNALGVAPDTDLVITFSEDVQKGTGSVLIKLSSDGSVVQAMDVGSAAVTVAGAVATINPPANLAETTGYYVEVPAGAFKDLGGSDFAGISGATAWNFTTGDFANPTVVSLLPADDATGVAPRANLVITFSEYVRKGTGNVLIKLSSDGSVVQTIDVGSAAVSMGDVLAVINPPGDLSESTGYYVEVAAGAFEDLAGNDFAGLSGPATWNFTTGDFTAPTAVSLVPVDGATGVVVDANLVIAFSENIRKGTGDVVLKRSKDGSVVETIPVTSATVTVSDATATIDPAATLAESTSYYVEVASGAFEDLAGNDFAGISGATAWNFTTGNFTVPTVVGLVPPDNATGVAIETNLLITFSEIVQKGDGLIVLRRSSDGSPVERIFVQSDAVTVAGATVTIDPAATLETNTGYYVEVYPEAFKDLGGFNFAGISGATAWNFTTTTGPPPAVAGTSPELVGTLPPFSTIDVTFTNAIDPATFGTRDVALLDLADLDVSLSGSFGGQFFDCVTVGSVVYAATGAGLEILDVSNPAGVTRLGWYDTSDTAYDVQVVGNLAYVASFAAGLQILDVSNPAAVTRLGGYDTPDAARGVHVVGNVAYVADWASGLQILDVSNPAAVTRLGAYDTPGSAFGVYVLGNVAYVADGSSGLQILDVSNPAAVTPLGGYDTSGFAYRVQVLGNVAYVADGDSNLQILDVSNPAAVTRLGAYDTSGWAYDVQVLGNVAYLANGSFGLEILDVSNPAAVTLLGAYDTSGLAYGVYVLGNQVYVADCEGGLKIVEVGSPAAGISHVAGNTYRVDLGRTLPESAYALLLGPDVLDAQGRAMDQDGDGTPREASDDVYFARFRVDEPAEVAGRYLFYNNSKFDGNDPAANAADDAAIAPGKEPLVPGAGKAAFKNYTSFSRGINGIMVDVAGLPAATLAASDFTFRYGNDDTPADWLAAADPTTIAVRAGAGTGGSDRMTLVWPDNAIPNGNWLQVTVLANDHTGLAANDVFYFGSAIGETGNSTADAKVNSQDVTRIRNNYTGFGTTGIESVYDFNRDRKVNSQDVTICRNYYSGFTPLKLFTPPSGMPPSETLGPPRAPEDTAEIRGTKWNDADGDRVWDTDEAGLEGVTLYLDLSENGQLDAGEPQTLTDEHGAYAFTGLAAGRYVVREVTPDGWRQTFPVVRDFPQGAAPMAETDALLRDLTTAGSAAPVSLSAEEVVAGEVGIETDVSTGLIRWDQFRADPRFAGVDGSGFATVILDTGIDLNHPFFGPDANGDGVADRIVYQYDFHNNDSNASDGNSHGSNVSSIIASQDATYPGMAPGASIIALKVLGDDGTGTFAALERALQWVVANAAGYHVASVNMSLGDGGNYTTTQSLYGLGDELAALANLGVIVVSASGNSFYSKGSQPGVGYPSADPNSLSIGAVYDSNAGGFSYGSGAVAYSTGADRLAPFSQRHATMTTVFAPGAPITGANASGGTVTYHGTSQAAPHVAGIAVLAQDLATRYLGRQLTQTELASLLRDTGVTIHDGDDEDDNVANTGLDFPRVDVLGLAEAIWLMHAPPGSQVVELDPGEVVVGVDFGNQILPGQVEGTVWDDADGSRSRDAGEPGLENVNVYADLNGNHALDPGEPYDVTDAAGHYLLVEVPPGDRAVAEVVPLGWECTFPVSGTHTVTVVSQQTTPDVDFGNRDVTGRVRGSAWKDLDGDGARDAGEPDLSGIVVYADLDESGHLDAGEPSAPTGADGTYVLERLLPRECVIAEVVPEGWRQTFPAAGAHRVTVLTGQTVEGIDFANQSLLGEIRGTLWSDLDGDGVKDAGEPGWAGATVYLDLDLSGHLDAGEPSAPTRADDPATPGVNEAGTYAFTDLGPGTYAAAELVPAGFVQTLPVPRQNEVRRVSVTYQGAQADFASFTNKLSDDGRYVLFNSGSGNLVPVAVSGQHYYVRDVVAGTTEVVSVNSAGQPGHPGGFNTFRADITPGGRYAVFACDAADLVPPDTNSRADVFLRDRTLGVTERISLAWDGSQPNSSCLGPAISDDGRYVVFQSSATNLVPNDNNGQDDVFLYDRQLRQLRLVSAGSNGNPANGYSRFPDVSGDGRYVVFHSTATNLVAEDTSSDTNVFLYDVQTGTLEIASRYAGGSKGEGWNPTISTDGRFIAFWSNAVYVAGDNNNLTDIFIRDRQTGAVYWASRAYNGSAGNNYNSRAEISADGRYVTFVSDASNLVPNDTNAARDVFLYSLDTNTLSRVSVTSTGGQVSDRSDDPSVCAGGRVVAFDSYASNVVPGDTNTYADVFTFTRDNYGQHLIAVAAGQVVEDVNFGNRDVVPPTVDVLDVTPDPRTTPVDKIAIAFSEAVAGFGLGDLALTRDGGGNLLPASGATLTSSDNVTWELGNLSLLTAKAGGYVLTLSAATSGIADPSGNALTTDAGDAWTTYSSVAGRRLFYNNSKFDAHTGFPDGDPAANEFDDGAIAPGKEALLPGAAKAAFKNYTSFSRGLNGIMIDVAGLPVTSLAATDFAFTCGNDDTPADWLAAADPTTVVVRAGAGSGGSDRVTLIWADNAIPNGNWLRVAVKASDRTGLAADDVFYFGSAIGETGNSTADAKVNSSDVTRIRNNYSAFGTVGIESVYDFNRDRKVNSQDVTICRNYYSGFTPLKLITAPSGMPPAEAPGPPRAPAGGTGILPVLPAQPWRDAGATRPDVVFDGYLSDWDARAYAELAWLDGLQDRRSKGNTTESQNTPQALADRLFVLFASDGVAVSPSYAVGKNLPRFPCVNGTQVQ